MTSFSAWGEAVTRGFPYGTYISIPCNQNEVEHIRHLVEVAELPNGAPFNLQNGVLLYRYLFPNAIVDLLVMPVKVPLHIQVVADMFPTKTDGRIIKMTEKDLRPGEYYKENNQTWVYLGAGFYKLIK